jgi:hypothetical protein
MRYIEFVDTDRKGFGWRWDVPPKATINCVEGWLRVDWSEGVGMPAHMRIFPAWRVREVIEDTTGNEPW